MNNFKITTNNILKCYLFYVYITILAITKFTIAKNQNNIIFFKIMDEKRVWSGKYLKNIFLRKNALPVAHI